MVDLARIVHGVPTERPPLVIVHGLFGSGRNWGAIARRLSEGAEARQVVAPVKKASANYRGLIAGLRKQIDALQNEVAALRRAAPKAEKALAAQEPHGRVWITGKGVKALRKRVGLTQALFGKLVGISAVTVANWEARKGKINLRKAAIARVQAVRKMGKKQAAEILGMGTAGGGKVNSRAKRRAKKA